MELHGGSDINTGSLLNRRGKIIPGSENNANNNDKKMWENTYLFFLLQKLYMFTVRRQTWIMVRKTKILTWNPKTQSHILVYALPHIK